MSDANHTSTRPNNRPTRKKKSKPPVIGCLVTFFLILLVAGGVGFYFWYEHQQEIDQEERDFAVLTGKNYNTADFEAFLEHYPNSIHRAEVMERLAALRRLHATWHNICNSQNVQNFRQFLYNFPDTESEYYVQCLHKIDSLDWVNACRRMTVASLSGYQQLHPDGEYAMAAALAIDSLREAEARQREMMADSAFLQAQIHGALADTIAIW